MRKFLVTIAVLAMLFVTGMASYQVSRAKSQKAIYQQDVENRAANIEISIKVLDLLRKGDHDKAVFGLETAMLGDLPALADDEKELGKKKEIQQAIAEASAYCSKYRVFDTNTNLPSHRAAKKIIDSHLSETANQ